MNETVMLTRYRTNDYLVNYHNGIKELTYKWYGYKPGSKPHTLAVPREVFDHLNMNTQAIKNGSLRVSDQEPKREEILNEMIDTEEAEKNSKTYEEYVALIKGNMNKMKKELNLITSRQEKRFVKKIKDELEESEEGLNNNKIEFINEWFASLDEEE